MSAEILCVDDDPNVLQAYRRGLRKSFQIDTASGGLEGLELVSQNTYAVVVSDFNMPGMNGIEFLKKVKMAAPDTVRMMLTGNQDLKIAMEAVNEGSIFRFLTKPCPPESLIKSLRAGIERWTRKTGPFVKVAPT